MIARENPFRSERVEGMGYRQAGFEWSELLGRAAEMKYRGAIVGPEGVGKTTLLEELGERLAEAGLCVRLVRLNNQVKLSWAELKREIIKEGGCDVLLLDGAEQMSRLMRYRLRSVTNKRKMGLIVTSHNEGMLPLLFECRTNEQLFFKLTWELLGETVSLSAVFTDRLYERHGGNIREALRELYDMWAEESKPRSKAVGQRYCSSRIF